MRIELVLGCFLAAPLLMAPSEQVRLQPSSQWVVDYADNSCRLIRMFGTGDNETKLVLESMSPDDVGMLVVGRQLGGVFPGADVKARFLPGQNDFFPGTAAESEQNGRAAALWSHIFLMPVLTTLGAVPPQFRAAMEEAKSRAKSGQRPPPIDLSVRASARAARLQFAEKVSELEIQPRPGHSVVLETGSLSAPVEIFDACVRDLLKGWGIDPAVQDRITRPAWTPNLRAWFGSGDYPTDALQRGQESQVRFQLVIDATGKVTKCTAISPFDAPIFNTTVCNALKQRARFAPAELSDGTKVPSYYTDVVAFRIAG
jgi:TonB family protein